MCKYKICFWLNTKSNHQNSFLRELNSNKAIDLQVRYISKPSQNRIDIGWDNSNLEDYELYVSTFHEAISSLEDYKERIHIILGNKITFSQELINLFIKENIKWAHWSERYGLVLANKLKFNITLFKIFRPIYLLTKFSYGRQVNKYALGAFSHGELAKKDFEYIGINKNKISDLFYTTDINLLEEDTKETDMHNTVNFLYIGELSKRKGIEDLIISCSKLNSNNWTLTIVGKDKSNGYYESFASKLNILNNVRFIGVVTHDKIHTYYKKADVFVFPSRFDGWGAVLNEAIIYSLPIISTDETSSSFTLIKDNGFIYKAGNINQLASCMKKYIDDKELIKQHSKNSKILSNICLAETNVNRFINALDNWSYNKND